MPPNPRSYKCDKILFPDCNFAGISFLPISYTYPENLTFLLYHNSNPEWLHKIRHFNVRLLKKQRGTWMKIKRSSVGCRWPRYLRRGDAAVRFLELRVLIPPGTWWFFSFECFVLSCRHLCAGLITHPEDSYREWCVWVCLWSIANEEAVAH